MAGEVAVKLNNGVKMPVIGFGLAADDTMVAKGSAPVDHIKASVLEAIQVGYRTFDTAKFYYTEGVLGEALKEAFEKGIVSRHEVFVTSKLWCTDCYPQDVIPALKKSLEALKVEMHPVWQKQKLREYCNSVNVHVSAWSPMGGPGNSWGSTHVLDNPLIKDIAAKHGKTPGQVALRWGIEKGVSVITRSFKPLRILENFQIFDWKLDGEDHEKIDSITQKQTELVKNLFVNPINGPFKTVHEFWDGEI